MKILVTVLLIAYLFTGCSGQNHPLDAFTEFRKELLTAPGCSFQAVVTADYWESVYTFQMDCLFDETGTLTFTVTDPETIAGITGTITDSSAALTFDDRVLAFPLLADGQLTPVSTPWIFFNALRSGYMSASSKEQNGYCLYVDDSYDENPLHLEIYTDDNYIPVRTELIWENCRILSADIRNFTIQ